MKRAFFERLTPKNRKNVPKFTKLSPTGGLRLQERMLLRNFEGKDARISGRDGEYGASTGTRQRFD